MDTCWNLDYRDAILRVLEPAVGPINTEYLTNEDGCISMELLRGEPNLVSFVDRGRIARYDFNLYVRTNGRDTASRKKAIDTLMAAARACVLATPVETGYIEMCEFPYLFNRNMSGNEEYKAGFSLFLRMQPEEALLLGTEESV